MGKVCYSCSFVIFFVPESLFMIGIPSIVAEDMPETPRLQRSGHSRRTSDYSTISKDMSKLP